MTAPALPPPTPGGGFVFPDGSVVCRSTVRPGKWVGYWAPRPGFSRGTPLMHEDRDGLTETTSYFDSAEEAVAALAAGGEGPGRPVPIPHAPSLADVADGEG